MRKLLVLFAFMVLLGMSSNAMAQTASSSGSTGHWTYGIGIGAAPTASGFGTGYNSVGIGLDANGGYAFDQNLSLLLAVDAFEMDTNVSGYNNQFVNIVPSIKYAFGTSKTKFYLIGGAGLNDFIVNLSSIYGNLSGSSTNFALEGGAGVDINVTPKLDIYVQAKYVDVLGNSGGSVSYIPITAGVQLN